MAHEPSIPLQSIYDMRNDTRLRNMATSACWNESETIRTEPDTTPNHAERLTWASSAVQDDGDGPVVQGMVRLAAQNAAIQLHYQTNNEFQDADILFVVRQNIDFFAINGLGPYTQGA